MTEAQGQPAGEVVESADIQPEQSQQTNAEETFTQADLKKIAANEKREGKHSAINDLLSKTGAESIEALVAGYEDYTAVQQAIETEAEKAQKARQKAEDRANAYQERYTTTIRDFALRDALRDAGVASESLSFVMRGIDKSQLVVEEDGSVVGVDDAVAAAQQEAPMLFGSQDNAANGRQRINAPQTAGTGVQAPGSMKDPEQAFANQLLGILGKQ